MADEQGVRGGSRGGIAAGPLGTGDEAPAERKPIGLDTGPPQPPLAAPANAVGFKKVTYGRTEIGLYRTQERVDDSKSAATIKRDFGSNNVNAYVTMSCNVTFFPRAERLKDKEIYQAHMFLRVTGPFIPHEVTTGRAKRAAKPAPPPPPKADPPDLWTQVRGRLLEHEMGHFSYTLKDLYTTGVFEVDLESDSLTYQQFRDYMIKQRDLWNTQVLLQSRQGWDNRDVDQCNEFLRNLYVVIPIEHD